MAVTYLHNAIYSPEDDSFLPPHRRNDSSTSGATTLHGSTENSHPTEPLLHHDIPAYFDLLPHQPPHSSGPGPQWTASLSLDGDRISERERKSFGEHLSRKRLRRLRWYKRLLETVIVAFAVYNTIRYFIAFTIYESAEGQATSLTLGICTMTVFAFTACASILSLFQPYMLLHHVPLSILLRTCTAFHSFASFALVAPAVVNTALLFVWKNSPIEELNIAHRCHVDIDVIWAVSSKTCKPPAWGIWIALCFLRLVITIVIITVYHWVATTYHRIHRPSLSHSRQSRHSQRHSTELYLPARSPSIAQASPPSFLPQQSHLHSQHHSSDSTLRSQSHSKNSSNHLSSPSVAVQSVYSDDDTEGTQRQPGSDPENQNQEVALDDYHEHFRTLVSQITRETEEGLELARNEPADTYPDTETVPAPNFQLSRIPPTIGYDEFGRPYPPDEHVPILNGYVRRMPTIESMGSREVGSMGSSRLSRSNSDTMTTSVRSSIPVSSRPPTRTNTLDGSFGSRPSSRTNSIAAGAEILLGAGRTNEVGELVDRTVGDLRTGSATTSSASSYPSTMSYYTATSYSSNPSGPPRSPTR